MSDNPATLGAGALGCNECGKAGMVKHVDDARALFGPFWSDVNDFQELNRDAQAGKAVNRWPLIKAMPINKRELPLVLSMPQKRAWIEQPVRSSSTAGSVAAPVNGRSSAVDPGKNGVASKDSLSDVFGRLEGTRRSLFQRLLGRSESTAQ
jgi:hypothetical protein